jgi:hypothetical protein
MSTVFGRRWTGKQVEHAAQIWRERVARRVDSRPQEFHRGNWDGDSHRVQERTEPARSLYLVAVRRLVGLGDHCLSGMGRPHLDRRHPVGDLADQSFAVGADAPTALPVLGLGQDELGRTIVSEGHRPQASWPIRGVWFMLIGWWASAIWTALAWLVQLTVLGIPIALLMFNRTPFVASLYRY